MLLELEKSVLNFIKSEHLFGLAERVLLGVSGGADSTALLHVMSRLKTEGVFKGTIVIAHLNHQLRDAESDGDQRFVIELGSKLGIEVVTRSFDVQKFSKENKLSIETAGRQLRIKNLISIARANNCKIVAVAHHAGDNAETILHRLMRGTGFRGLAGIWPARELADGVRFVRPLLEAGRSDIVEYLKKRGLLWRTDRTNEDYIYRRNFIRHKLTPYLQKQSDGLLERQLLELSRAARKFYEFVYKYTEDIFGKAADCETDRVTIDSELVLSQHPAVQVELIRRALEFLKCGEKDITERHYEKILQLAKNNKSGKRLELPGGFVAEYAYGELSFFKGVELEKPMCESVTIEVPGRTKSGRYLIEASVLEAKKSDFEKFKSAKTNFVEWFDLEKLKLPLKIRGREKGDRFVPLGLGREKRVGKFLTAQRVPQRLRGKAVVICDSEKIIWVCPVRTAESTKITSKTERILELRIIESNSG